MTTRTTLDCNGRVLLWAWAPSRLQPGTAHGRWVRVTRARADLALSADLHQLAASL